MHITTSNSGPVITVDIPEGVDHVNINFDEGVEDSDIGEGCHHHHCHSNKPGNGNGNGNSNYVESLQDGSITLHLNSPQAKVEFGLSVKDFLRLVMSGELSQNRPSEYNAAKTLNEFMKDNDIDVLNKKELEQLAQGGTFKLPSGEEVEIPEEVQEAAQKMLENDGALFEKLKSANITVSEGNGPNGDNGNLPSLEDASQTMSDFIRDNKTGPISKEQVALMAQTGEFKKDDGTVIELTPQQQAAAQRMLQGNDFTAIESALTGKTDGLLGEGDHAAAKKKSLLNNETTGAGGNNGGGTVNINIPDDEGYFSDDEGEVTINLNRPNGANGNGNNLPSLEDASESISNFIRDNKLGTINKEQLALMAQTGEFKKDDGTVIELTPQQQAAAQRMLQGNDFTAIESALTGETDGLLSEYDHGAAKDKSLLNNEPAGNGGNGGTVDISFQGGNGNYHINVNGPNGANGNGNDLPSLEDASSTLSNFIRDNKTGPISKEQIALMAQTGEFKKDDGTVIELTPQQQAAAQRMLQGNDFTAIESALTGETDGLLGEGDHAAAKNKSLLNNETTGAGGNNGGGTVNINIPDDEGYFSDDEGEVTINLNRPNGNGNNLPSLEDASQTMSDFIRDNKTGPISKEQVALMAQTGEFKKDDGTVIELTPEQQAAAQRMLQGNDFTAVESALKGETDDLLGEGDHAAAKDKGYLNN